MAKQFPSLTDDHCRFIADQHVFFTGSAAPDGRVNVSPKGMDSLRVRGPNRLLWRNLTGSGNETAGHLREHPRVTLMWCSFSRRPLILQAYGTARAVHCDHADWDELSSVFPPHRGARQVFDMTIDLVQTSCGYAVPFMDFTGERDALSKWTQAKSDADLRAYWQDKNARTIDGKPTGVPIP
ncbi:pyridoxamine 5'-phosphate oxidase family protein [Sedimentitalea sp. JM2-8]|uniref:Pyridoxamine 5'-phosphate oxidase family protein n=1 Tax=Sedimentitalea xiamensis TaxID=3050037 RepID=A0ABT7FB87_9RHOB|nr:pyridoxamine 5'-phosphate oxidase family protein [Sedimentitalea xiamensis]MDK3072362.1 pyridoxamine 5'-phosphate oxidase family protein [Sedimentitalea xiamensis]